MPSGADSLFIGRWLYNGQEKNNNCRINIACSPFFFTDNYIASDVSNPSTYVRKADIEATNWIKKNLPLEAIIQAEPNYPEIENEKKPLYSYSLIPIFAERRTAIGEWKASSQEHSRPSEVRERFHSVKKMFFTTDIYECVQILKKYNIEYIYIGELEKNVSEWCSQV